MSRQKENAFSLFKCCFSNFKIFKFNVLKCVFTIKSKVFAKKLSIMLIIFECHGSNFFISFLMFKSQSHTAYDMLSPKGKEIVEHIPQERSYDMNKFQTHMSCLKQN